MRESFDSQSLGRRVNELLILSQLRRQPLHGYQIALEIEERSSGYFPFNHGTLYPILHRLEKEGLIAGGWSDPDEGRARKQYALTDAGRSYLEEVVRGWRTLEAELGPFLGAGGSSQERARTGAA
jgi:PadR family transcriptional regulator, regulatory protein PadR